MPPGDKRSYTGKQKRKAEHIVEGYEFPEGVEPEEAERRAWATVNKESGGGNQSGSGRGKPETTVSSKKGGRIGGRRPPPTGRQRRSPLPPGRRRRHAGEMRRSRLGDHCPGCA